MPARMEHKQPSLCRAGCPSLSGFAATDAARAAHKGSLEKFSQFCRAAVNLRRQAELGAHRNEWVDYAAELRSVERSLQLDLHSVNLLVSRIQSHTQLSINADPLPHDPQKAARVGALPERENTVVKGSLAEPLGNGTNEMKKEFWCPTLWGRRYPAGLPAALTRVQINEYTSPTSGPLRRTAAPQSEECAEPEEKSADVTASSTASTLNTLKHPVPVLQEEAPNGGVHLLRKAQTLTNVLTRQVSGDEGTQMKSILQLKRCANILAQYFSTDLMAGKKQSSVNTNTSETESPVPFAKVFSAIRRYKRDVSREKSNQSAANRHQLVACDAHNHCIADRDSVALSCKDDSSTFCEKTSRQSMKPKHDGTRLVPCGQSFTRYTRTKELQYSRCIPAIHSSQKGIPARNVCSSIGSCFISFPQPSPATTKEYDVQFLKHSGIYQSLPPKDPGAGCDELQGAAQQVEDLQDSRDPKKSRNVSEQAGIPTKQQTDQHGDATQQGFQAMQTQYESVLSQRKFMAQESLPVNYQVSCGTTQAIFHHIADFAVLLQMQHGILDHMRRQLQQEEASAEQEVRRTRVHLHHLIRDRAVFSRLLVPSHRSRTNAGKRMHKSNECAGGSSSGSRFSTESDSQLQCQNQTHPDRDTHSSGDITDEEQELLQELTEAEDQYRCVSSSVEGQRSVPGKCNAIVQLRRRYVSELEKLEVDLEKQLNRYNQQADDLNIQRQSLLHKACGSRGSKPLQGHEKALDRLSARGALCGQGSCDLRQHTSTFPYLCAKESGTRARDESAHTCPAELMQSINLERVNDEEDYKRRAAPASHTTRDSPSPCVAPTCQQDMVATAAPAPVVDAASMSNDCTASAVVLEEVVRNQEAESKCETTFSRSPLVDRNSAIALLRYATTEFQHSNTGRLQQTGCTLLGKLQLIFPEASAETLRKLLYVDKQFLLLQQRRTAALWGFARRRERALTATREQLSQLTVRLEEEGRRKEQDVQLRKRMAVLQKRLDVQRQQAEERQTALRNAAEASAAAENAQKAIRMKREQQRRAEDKRLLAEHREARAAACRQQEQEAAAAAEEEALERAARARRNRHVLLRRREEDLWKSRMQAQARQYEALRQAQVIEHLLKLAAKYAVYVPADPHRVQQPTCASQARVEQIRAERQEAEELQGSGHRLLQGHSFACFEVPHGYSVEKLLSDMRLRLSTALHEAGLSQTRAGREALLGLHAQAMPLSEGAT